ncbi:MAG: hypothetical protein IT180_04565 [Acidobacteria bacterium]|nr:hypothetical protein [Acidobacteriota bacterium]
MAETTEREKWSEVKARLEALDRKGLVSLIGDLYDASGANRRFLHSRLAPGSRAIEEYRQLVADAVDELVHALDARAARAKSGKVDRR